MSLTSGKGNYLAKKFIEVALGAASFTPAVTLYCALYTATPSATGGGTEVSGGAYARVAITNNNTNFPASSLVGGVTTLLNGVAIDFGTATGADWGTIGWAALWDASSSGNLYYWGPLAVARTVLNGDGFKIPVSGATFTEV